MEFKTFTRKCISLFHSKKHDKKISKQIIRGRAVDCSSDIENLLAKTLQEVLPNSYTFLIDYPLSINGIRRTKTIFPDIALIKDNTLKGIVEVKIDLGFLGKDWISNSNKIFNLIKDSKYLTYKTNVGRLDKEKIKLNVSPSIKRAVIVITGKNDHGKMKNFNRMQENCFVLMPDHHPNSSKITNKQIKFFISEISNNSEGWDKMIHYFNKNFK